MKVRLPALREFNKRLRSQRDFVVLHKDAKFRGKTLYQALGEKQGITAIVKSVLVNKVYKE